MLDGTCARFFGFIHGRPLPFAFETLEDGRELKIGKSTIACILTPGHTAGSMSYLVDGSALIVGDIFNLKSGEAILDRRWINVDNEARERSLRALARFEGVELVCTAHSGYSRDFAAAMRRWR